MEAPKPINTPPALNTAGLGVARADAIRTYVQQHAVITPAAHCAVLQPDRRLRFVVAK